MKTNPSVPSLIQRTRGYPITALGDSFPVGNLGRGSTAGDTQASQCFTRLIAHPRSAESVAFPAFSIDRRKEEGGPGDGGATDKENVSTGISVKG